MVSLSDYNSKRLLVLVFLLFFITVPSVFAQVSGLPLEAVDAGLGGGNAITGTVLSPSGQRMETRIKVRLSTMTRGDTVAVTDESGKFSFRGLPSGNYTIIIDKEKEYEPLTESIDIIQFRGSPPQVYNVNIRLKQKANTDLKPGVINPELANVPKDALNFYTKAAELTKKGDYKGAIEQLRLSISAYPNFISAYNELGVQYLRLNELEKADEAFRSALKINPGAFAPLMNRGIVLVQMKQFDKAETVLRNALKIKDQSPVTHYFLGQALANMGRFDEAENELLSSIKSGGDEMKEAHRFLAIMYSAKGDKKRAADQLETYLRLAPKAPDTEQLRSVLQQLKSSNEKTPAIKSPL